MPEMVQHDSFRQGAQEVFAERYERNGAYQRQRAVYDKALSPSHEGSE